MMNNNNNSGNVWERFNNIADVNEVLEAKSQFEPIAAGTYDMILEDMQASETKNTGLPMLKAKFRLTESNRVLFYNQVLQNINYPHMTAVNIAEATSLISNLTNQYVEFQGMGQFAELIDNVPTGTTHQITVSYGPKDVEKSFPKLTVIEPEVKDVEEVEPVVQYGIRY